MSSFPNYEAFAALVFEEPNNSYMDPEVFERLGGPAGFTNEERIEWLRHYFENRDRKHQKKTGRELKELNKFYDKQGCHIF